MKRKRGKHELFLLLPALVLAGIGLAFWLKPHAVKRNKPYAGTISLTDAEKKARELLLAADTVRVELETVECYSSEGPGCGPARKFVAWLKPSELRPFVNGLKLTRAEPSGWGTGYVPALCFMLYRDGYREGQQLAEFSLGYSSLPYDYLTIPLSAFHPKKSQGSVTRGLHPGTVRHLRKLVARHPEMQNALKAVSAGSLTIWAGTSGKSGGAP